MDLFEAIRTRRTHRGDFAPDPISEAHKERLIEAARWAPSPFNVQPWELVFITDPLLKEQLAELVSRCIQKQFQDPHFLADTGRWMRLTREEWRRLGDGVLLEEHLKLPPFLKNPARLRPLLDRAARLAFLGRLGLGKLPAREFARWVRQAPLLIAVFLDWRRRCPGEGGRDWMMLGLGAMIQNLLLAATELGIGTQFLSAPLESKADREAVRRLVGAPEGTEPLALLRLGYLLEEPPEGARRRDIVHHNRWRGTSHGSA